MSIGISSGNVANPNPEPHPENLKPFQPGQSGNPKGSSEAVRTKAEIAKQLDLPAFIAAGIDYGMKGSFPFYRYILDRFAGQMPKPEVSASDLEQLNQMIEEAEAEHERTQQTSGSGAGPMPQ